MNNFKEYLIESKKKTTKIGFVGFSDKKFDKEKAQEYIKEAFDDLIKDEEKVEIVSGLTDLGIPALVYKEAEKRKIKTVGIACKKAEQYKCFKCDKVILVGNEWGDESKEFLDYIDILVKIGGGKQAEKEFKQAKEKGIKTLEFELKEEK